MEVPTKIKNNKITLELYILQVYLHTTKTNLAANLKNTNKF